MSFRYKGGILSATAPTTSASPTGDKGVWTLESQLQAQAAGTWPPLNYKISRSLLFNSSDASYLTRTPATAGSATTFTFSAWVKRGQIGATNVTQYLFSGGTASTYIGFGQLTTDDLSGNLRGTGATNYFFATSGLFRDPSAWYHVVWSVDTTQATAANRVMVYVNGVLQTLGTANYPPQNTTLLTASARYLGQSGSSTYYLDGYMTEVNFIDGQQLAPTYFGSFDNNGVWTPAAYGGSYGTNGFYLNFSDNSNTTSSTLGKDYSGNGNDWTPTNFSVAAGVNNDSYVDSPTSYGTDTGVGGEVRGNYAVVSPVYGNQDPTWGIATSIGNLRGVSNNVSGNVNCWQVTTLKMKTGKWYCEVTNMGSNRLYVGVGGFLQPSSNDAVTWNYAALYDVLVNGSVFLNGTSAGSTGVTFTTSDIMGIAYDADNKTITWYKNGSAITGATGKTFTYQPNCVDAYFTAVAYGNPASGVTWNFGQHPFTYTAPSGYKALCSTNLATPAVANGSQYMAATLYTGTGAIASISNAVNGVSFKPDLVWLKTRSAAYGHALFDSTRGVGNGLQTNNTNTQTAWGSSTLSSFNVDGFGLGADTTYLIANNSGTTYVGWQWKANGGTTVSNASGTITSTVQANTTAGFSVVSYTGTGVNATVGHGLGVAPGFIIVKCLNQAARYWAVYSNGSGATNLLYLNTTDTATATALAWNNTAPTTTVFSIGTGADTNSSTYNFVAYCFAEVTGFSKMGYYTGTGSANGPFVYCGFRPKFVLLKRTDAVASWAIMDTSRDVYNAAGLDLYPNLANAETDDRPMLDILSNGFKLRSTYVSTNVSGGNYIYIAFAENPFNYSRAR